MRAQLLVVGVFPMIAMLPDGSLPAADGARERERIEIVVDMGSFRGPGTSPLGAGVPLPEGKMKSVTALRLRGEKQGVLPVQITKRTEWPDGSVKWIWLDFQGQPSDRYFLEMAPDPPPMPKPETPLRVEQTERTLGIDTGRMRVVWNREFASPILVEAPGMSSIQDGGRGIYVMDHRGRKGVLGGDGAELSWTVEAAGPIRAVIRIEGWFVTSEGERLARAVVRYHAYAGRMFFTMDHTFIFTEDTDRLWFKEVAVRFPWRGKVPCPARFGVRRAKDGANEAKDEAKDVVAELQGHGDQAWVFQDDYPHFAQTRTHFSAGRRAAGKEEIVREGTVAAGWCEASDGHSGITLAVRDFAPQFPKELLVDSNGATALLWSNRGGKKLDYRPATLVKDYYGEDWIAGLRRKVPGGHGIVANVTPEGFKKLNPTGLGSARTHQIFCGYHAGAPDDGVSAEWGATFEKPPMGLADPTWLCSSGAFWPIAPKQEERFPRAERLISEFFDRWLGSMSEFPMTGWINRGVGPELQYERRENGRVYASFYRLMNVAAYNFPKHVWIAYLRSGQRKYLDFAERNTRLLADNKVNHWGGGARRKEKGLIAAAGNFHLPFYWDSGPGLIDTGGTSTDYLAPLWMGYFLRDMRWAADPLVLYTDAVNHAWRLEAMRKRTTPFTALSQMMSAWRVTRDAELEKKIHELADALINLDHPLGISATFYTGTSRYGRVSYKTDRKVTALIEYYDLFGVEKAKQAVLKATEELFPRACAKRPLSYQNVTPMYLMRCYEWSGNRSYRAAAVMQVRSALDWFREYESLPANERWREDSKFKPHLQGFPFFSMPHVLQDLADDSFEQEGVFPYHANLGRDEECPIHVMKKAGEPVELLVQVITLRGELHPTDTPCEVTGPGDGHADAVVEKTSSGAYRVVIPGPSPSGCYRVSAGLNRFLVIGCTAEKVVLAFPDGTYFGHKDGAGFAVVRDRSFYFHVPKEQTTFSMRVSRPIRIHDPSGREIEAARDKTGRIVVSSDDKSGLWSFMPGPVAFVRFEDLVPVVAFGDSGRFFSPPGVDPARPERAWTAPAEEGLVDGRFGRGLHIAGRAFRARWNRLQEATGFPFPQGTIECFIRSDWSTCWSPQKSLTALWTARPFYLGYRNQPDTEMGQMFLTWMQFHPNGETGKGWLHRVEAYASFKAGEWNHIACTWRQDPPRYVVYQNGHKIGELAEPTPKGESDGRFSLGPLRATYDELRVSRVVRYEENFAPPTAPFVEDRNTVVLFHFNQDLRAAGKDRAPEFVKD